MAPAMSLKDVLTSNLSAYVQQLQNAQHLDGGMSSTQLELDIKRWAYGFLSEPAYVELFQPFAPDRQHDSDDHESEQDDEDDEEPWSLSRAQAKARRSGLASEYASSRKGKPCGHVFMKGESVYRCKECSLDDSCVLCTKCFKASNHEGHDVSFSVHSGGCGCCDCGDHEAWKCEIDCAYHNPNVPYPSDIENGDVPHTSAQVPKAFQDAFLEQVSSALDFIIETLQTFPHHHTAPTSIDKLRSIEPLTKLMVDNSELWRSSSSGSQSSPSANPHFEGPWSLILWNDEKHSYEQVIRVVSEGTRCSRAHALASAMTVDKTGLEIVMTSSNAHLTWKAAQIIAGIDLSVTVVGAHDAAIFPAIGYLLDWLADMVKTSIGGDEVLLGRLVARALLTDLRLGKLMVVEERLYKSARASLRHIMMSLLVVGADVKLELGTQYSAVYPEVISSFLLTDREPESSITQLSVQIFSAPSIAKKLVEQHRFLDIQALVMFAYFTMQHKEGSGARKVLLFPPNMDRVVANPDSEAFRQKRSDQLFHDIGHLLCHPAVRKHISTRPGSSLIYLMAFFSLFIGMNPQVRAATEHIEYEADTWVSAFNLAVQLARVIRNTGRAYHVEEGETSYVVTAKEYLAGLSDIFHQMTISVMDFRVHGVHGAPLHTVVFANKEWEVVKYQISVEPVSFHHPLHLLFAEVLKNVNGWTEAAFLSASDGQINSIGSLMAKIKPGTRNPLYTIVDEVVRVLALLAQIRANFWVRNGYGIRAQQLHYREYRLREDTFDQDIFFLQAATVFLDPELLLVSMLDRYELLPMLSNVETGTQDKPSVYEESQGLKVLNELLSNLIIIFSEPADIEGWTLDDYVRRELIHTILPGSKTYSEIYKTTTSRTGESASYDRILSEVADFKTPENITTSDIGGTYTLKQECLGEVDPYYYRYVPNQREVVMRIIREHTKSPVFQPRKLQPKGAFDQNIGFTKLLGSKAFVTLLALSLRCAWEREVADDDILDSALHLCTIALVEDPEAFSKRVAGHEAMMGLLKSLEEHSKTDTFQARATYILDKLEAIQPDMVRQYRAKESVQQKPQDGKDAADQKKQAAKARQAAIMQQFAAASKSFLEENDISDEDEDLSLETDGGIVEDADVQRMVIPGDLSSDHSAEARRKGRIAKLGGCILCQEDLDTEQPFGFLGLIQSSAVIRLSPSEARFQNEVTDVPSDLDQDLSAVRPFGVMGKETDDREGRGGTAFGFPRHTRKGLFANACGHLMHLSCFEEYCKSIHQRHLTQTRNHPEDTERKEFLCPLCRSLGNIILPISEDELEGGPEPSTNSPGLSEDWLAGAAEACSPASGDLNSALQCLLRDGSGRMRAWQVSEELPVNPARYGLDVTVTPAEKKMLRRLWQVVYALQLESHFFEEDNEQDKARTVSHELVNYTFATIEIALRGKAVSVLNPDSIPEYTSRLLRSLLYVLERLAMIGTGTARGPDLTKTALLWVMFGRRNGRYTRQHFLDRDPFTFLVESVAVAPEDFHQFVILTFYAHLLRTSYKLISETGSKDSKSQRPAETNADVTALAEFASMLHYDRWHRGAVPAASSIDGQAGLNADRLYAHALPFLRRAAILHAVIYPDAIPEASEGTEMARLLHQLRIPHPRELIGRKHGKSRPSTLASILEEWDGSWLQPSSDPTSPWMANQVQLEHPVIYELLGMPKHIDGLIQSCATRKCQNCRQVPSEPAICVICGELLCSQSYCCASADGDDDLGHGECNRHMFECGTSIGIFFIVKKCMLLYLYANKGSFAPAPYLDSHGETDPGLRKRRPLYWQFARYEDARKLWLNHQIASYIARKTEATSDPGGWNTF